MFRIFFGALLVKCELSGVLLHEEILQPIEALRFGNVDALERSAGGRWRIINEPGHEARKSDRGLAHAVIACTGLNNLRVVDGPERLYAPRSEEHTSELQSRGHLVCRRL